MRVVAVSEPRYGATHHCAPYDSDVDEKGTQLFEAAL